MNNRTSLLKPLSTLMTLKFLLLCGLIAISFSLKANEAGIDNPCLETGGGWYCSKLGEVDDVSHDGDNEYTIQVGGSIDLPGIYATLSRGEKRNNFRCPDTPGYGEGPVEVTYNSESRWSPELPSTFDQPGVFEFTSQARGISTDSVCQDTGWVDGNTIKVKVVIVTEISIPQKVFVKQGVEEHSAKVEITAKLNLEAGVNLIWQGKRNDGSWIDIASQSGLILSPLLPNGTWQFRARFGEDAEWTESDKIYVGGLKIFGPPQSQDGVESGEFRVDLFPPLAENVTYEWTYGIPENSVRAPEGDIFSNLNEKITKVTKPMWFGPNNTVYRYSSIHEDGNPPDCEYMIGCNISIFGENVDDIEKITWKVLVYENSPSVSPRNFEMTPGKSLEPLKILEVFSGSNSKITVTGVHFIRVEPVLHKQGMVVENSFYSKIITVHEGKHVNQWTNEAPWSTLYDIDTLSGFFIGKEFEGTRTQSAAVEADWQSKAANLYLSYNQACNDYRVMTFNWREVDAHTLSNLEGPLFLKADLREYPLPTDPYPPHPSLILVNPFPPNP